MTLTPAEAQWTRSQLISFRYLFVFFSLIIFPFPLSLIPGSDVIFDVYTEGWTALINLAETTFFGVAEEIKLQFTGSGDKLYDWLWYFCVLVLTVVIGTVFTILDRKRQSYERLAGWFLLVVTYYLAYYMLTYGIIKLFYLQFGAPNLERLHQTFGQASPMRLLWTFMGFSKSYTVFAGFCETVAGLLLLFRRTRTLGALTTMGVMLNVFLLNMSYDVPVKLFSFQLMLIGAYLAHLDRERVLNLFLYNKTAEPIDERPLVASKNGKYIVLGVQVLFAGYVIFNLVTSSMENRERYGEARAKSALYGVYNVQEFIVNGDTLPPLITDSTRWRRLLFDYASFASVIMMDDKVTRYDTEIDTVAQTILFSPRGDTINQYPFDYDRTATMLSLDGVLAGDTLSVSAEHYPLSKFGLLNRGFNWVNEVPYNRYNYD